MLAADLCPDTVLTLVLTGNPAPSTTGLYRVLMSSCNLPASRWPYSCEAKIA
jgi:hypothetical protein